MCVHAHNSCRTNLSATPYRPRHGFSLSYVGGNSSMSTRRGVVRTESGTVKPAYGLVVAFVAIACTAAVAAVIASTTRGVNTAGAADNRVEAVNPAPAM